MALDKAARMSLGETYVIRIYRRGKSAAKGDGGTTPKRRSTDRVVLAGLIEDPVSGQTWVFREANELVSMLCEVAARAAARNRNQEKKR